MAAVSKGAACGVCGAGKCKETLAAGIRGNNPVLVQAIGICSCLAVTNKVENAMVMGIALTATASLSGLFMSMIRNITPPRIRMIVEIALISVFVICFDQILKALYWDMSKQLGPYVGLIITNCILMGRLEAFALQNPPMLSLVDGFSNGLGYALVLVFVGCVRELVGAGTLLGMVVLPESLYQTNLLFVLAPGAFFTMGLLIWLVNAFGPRKPEKKP
ncbi:MAG: NADH:ubiquinone reductase (Na(+)-transporting) subunit D [Lentisphaerae bacterium RIFOXYC12_FULL_60_16]|nr:MAG: NADH:ubiquinone reductase (Na(+)-transporting) subunit D [Lentisphaerae bacterium RIFOXYC12_FULL_60_16]OGV74696.1 MAG: NADH:ubiquinone reductase (Na(+)-transporting) subunit D [Lentisphaerae bacterium RIFOXYA12_FULL_60_10]OGV84918.1 MAG: NADH:ubiquinone reductase (Na(+)-transporting) subunit D [Lentisphaerae bacterium RIFOXYB12_FULL_60_10]